MPRSRSLDLDTFDHEINKTLRLSREKKKKEAATLLMTNQNHNVDKVLKDYVVIN